MNITFEIRKHKYFFQSEWVNMKKKNENIQKITNNTNKYDSDEITYHRGFRYPLA